MSATHCFESGTWRSFSYLSQKMNETVGPTARTMTDLNTTEANFAITPDSPGTLWRTSVIACIAAINIFLSTSASLSNVLILISLQKVSTLHKPTKLLFQSLAVTDLFVGLILQPFHATFLLSLLTKMDTRATFYIEEINPFVSITLCGVSVLTSTAISVDRLLALYLGLRYRQVVTMSRVRAFVASSWLIGVSCGSLQIWSSRIAWIIASICAALCMLTSIFSYTKIQILLRHRQIQIQVRQGQPSAGKIGLNIERYKATVSAIFWIQVTLLGCYVPFCIVTVLRIFNEKQLYITWLGTATLVYLNSSLNPSLYCWKIREVRQSLKETVAQFCNCALS